MISSCIIILLVVALVVVKVVLPFYQGYHPIADDLGKEGEQRVASLLQQLPAEYLTLNDVIIRKGIRTVQIDHVVISKYGIFTIETKNYKGEIYGNDKSKNWTQIIATDVTYTRKWNKTYTYITKNRLYNPVKQSIGHSNVLRTMFGRYHYLPIVPMVVFAGDATLNITTNHVVIYLKQLLNTIQSYKTIYLSDSDVNDIIKEINSRNVRGIVTNQEHIRNIQRQQQESASKIRTGICPRCGGTLIKRNGKYGIFYGCSNYPKCKYTLNTR